MVRRKRERNAQSGRKRRALKKNAPSEKYTLAQVARRTDYVCGICYEYVDLSLPGLHPRGPNIDHIIPLARGGHDVLDNVQLAHKECNHVKSDKILVEPHEHDWQPTGDCPDCDDDRCCVDCSMCALVDCYCWD